MVTLSLDVKQVLEHYQYQGTSKDTILLSEPGIANMIIKMPTALFSWGAQSRDTMSFPQFLMLPQEIQDMIWEECIPARLVVLTCSTERNLDIRAPLNQQRPPVISQVCHSARHVALRSVIGITFISGLRILDLDGTFTEDAVAGTVESVNQNDFYVAHRLGLATNIPEHGDFGPFHVLPTRVGHTLRASGDERVMIQTWYDTRRDTLFLRDLAHASPLHWRNALDDESQFNTNMDSEHWPIYFARRQANSSKALVHSGTHQCTSLASKKRVFDSIRIAGCFSETNPWRTNGWTEFMNPCISASLSSRHRQNELTYLTGPDVEPIMAHRSEAIDSGFFGLWAENKIITADLDDQKLLRSLTKLDKIQCPRPWLFSMAETALHRELLMAYRFSEQHEGDHPPGTSAVCRFNLKQPCAFIDNNKWREILDSMPRMRRKFVFRLELLPDPPLSLSHRLPFSLSEFLGKLFLSGLIVLRLLFLTVRKWLRPA